jgi:hypothetical protein
MIGDNTYTSSWAECSGFEIPVISQVPPSIATGCRCCENPRGSVIPTGARRASAEWSGGI